MPAVVAEGDGLGERDVQPAGPGDGGGDLRHLERVGQPGALVVLGEDEDLGLAGQAAEGGGVEDAVAVALEAGAPRVGLLGPGRSPAPAARVAPGASSDCLELLALGAAAGQHRLGARRRRRRPGAGPIRACESAWARRTGPE